MKGSDVILLAVPADEVLETINLIATAGDLEPSAGPGSTMKTLDEIYAAVTAAPPEPVREPYFREFNVGHHYSAKKEVLTAPVGKRLVILKMYVSHYNWAIASCSGNCSLAYQFETVLEGPTFDGFSDTMQYVHEFPDGSIAFEGGQTLWLVNRDLQGTNLKALLFGYVCDAQ